MDDCTQGNLRKWEKLDLRQLIGIGRDTYMKIKHHNRWKQEANCILLTFENLKWSRWSPCRELTRIKFLLMFYFRECISAHSNKLTQVQIFHLLKFLRVHCSHPCTYTHKYGIKRCRRMYSNHILQPFMKILLWDITAYHKRVYFFIDSRCLHETAYLHTKQSKLKWAISFCCSYKNSYKFKKFVFKNWFLWMKIFPLHINHK